MTWHHSVISQRHTKASNAADPTSSKRGAKAKRFELVDLLLLEFESVKSNRFGHVRFPPRQRR